MADNHSPQQMRPILNIITDHLADFQRFTQQMLAQKVLFERKRDGDG